MRVLLVHNSYLQPGGEDVVFEQEKELLRSYGNDVIEFHRRNSRIDGVVRHKFAVARSVLWASDSVLAIRDMIIRHRPEVAHFQNVFGVISPSCYYACHELGVPVVQTVHNYRLVCPSADLFRNGQSCESCVGRRIAWPGVAHRCYHASRLQTTVVAMMIAGHQWLNTWESQVDTYIAPSECIRRTLIRGGFSPNKILLKPNFVGSDPGYKHASGSKYAVFAGRLSREKGVDVLVEAWKHISELPLLILGDGTEKSRIEMLIESAKLTNIEMLGYKPRADLLEIVKDAAFVIVPSQWPEAFGLAVIEAFACGVPVIATRIGAFPELIEEGRTGLMFGPGSSTELANKVKWAVQHPLEMDAIGIAARGEYERRYTAATNYPLLSGIYEKTIHEFQIAEGTGQSPPIVRNELGVKV